MTVRHYNDDETTAKEINEICTRALTMAMQEAAQNQICGGCLLQHLLVFAFANAYIRVAETAKGVIPKPEELPLFTALVMGQDVAKDGYSMAVRMAEPGAKIKIVDATVPPAH